MNSALFKTLLASITATSNRRHTHIAATAGPSTPRNSKRVYRDYVVREAIMWEDRWAGPQGEAVWTARLGQLNFKNIWEYERTSEESRAAGCRGRTAPVRVAVVLRPKVAPRGLGVGRARGQGPLRAAALVRPTSSRGTQHAIVWHALSSLAGSALAAHAPVRGARGAVARGQRVERQRSGLKVTDHHRCGGAWVVARGRRGRRATNLQNKG